MTDQAKQDRDEREVRLEKARKELLATVETLRGEMLTQKERTQWKQRLKTSLSRCAWAPSRRALMIYTALASMIAIAIRPLVVSVANVEVKVGLSTEGVPRPRADLNVTSMAKAFPNPALQSP